MKTYSERMPESWAEVLRPLGTDHVKEHLTEAPWVVVLFRHSKRVRDNGEWAPPTTHRSHAESLTGLFISAVHNMGLVTLTHTRPQWAFSGRYSRGQTMSMPC